MLIRSFSEVTSSNSPEQKHVQFPVKENRLQQKILTMEEQQCLDIVWSSIAD